MGFTAVAMLAAYSVQVCRVGCTSLSCLRKRMSRGICQHSSDPPAPHIAHYAMDISSSNSNLWPAVRARDQEANMNKMIPPYARVMGPNYGFHDDFPDEVSYDDF